MTDSSDKITIDQLADLLGLPSWESVDELNQYYYHQLVPSDLNDEAYIVAQEKVQTKVYNHWYDAVYSVASQLFGAHGLELHTWPGHANEPRTYDMEIEPNWTWTVAADQIRQTINAIGMFRFSSLEEFLDSGRYSPREAVLQHLSVIPCRVEVYGDLSPRRLYEMAW